ncbi:aminoacyl-histidine dipeptidase [Chlorobium sp. BLA1]|uniref:aminoacyl-histidine dipeptidase n=1 Tax=Candidatus Chlorobium masyuteum TaxID=2716876 RepID=UPI0014208EF2|nr:aminoacyl-histidine dipeptidase [Candidatus Chlorobium masyuteum]NHQ60661.1 aminoacyl-histidine dipeptidase [Candidatus Chlorobium masyuteum]
MNNDISGLSPHEVWRHFQSLTRIPRPSGHEEKIREFMTAFGRNLGLESIVDDADNVIIRKPATSGLENRKGVILQAHLDMVPQKNTGKSHDFAKDPIETIIDGEWVRADGTTLGADNGVGVAVAMAVLESTTLKHGPIEALFTSNEEAGMSGAMGLKPGVLKGEILMNLDSEDDGELFIGCAGGVNVTSTFNYTEHALSEDYQGFRISVTGLMGGHSGVDIHLGRGNANKIMNRILYEGHIGYGLQLISIDGGSLRNAIPRESFAVAAVPEVTAAAFLDRLSVLRGTIQDELRAVEPALQIEVVSVSLPETAIEPAVFLRLMKAIYACPNGVMRMSSEMEGLVETSNNLAMVKSGNGTIAVDSLVRSSVDSAKVDLEHMITALFDLAGAGSVVDGGYPGWKPDPESPILKIMQDLFQKKFGKIPVTSAVHAGLECGIIGGAYPALDMISFGPTIRYPHSPDEKVHIPSVGKFWDLLVAVLGDIPVKNL